MMASSRFSMFRRGFTIIELIVAVSLLVIIILSISLIFRSATKTISVSQALNEMMSNTRGAMSQIDRDISSVDRNGFLVIKSISDGSGNRYDQIAFLATGRFSNLTGSTAANPFSDNTASNSAIVWIGQGVKEIAGGGTYNPAPSASDASAAMNLPTPAWTVPGGFDPNNQVSPNGTEFDFVLCRHATLLLPSATNTIPSSSPITVFPTPDKSASVGGYSIVSSRYAAAQMTPGQLMSGILAQRTPPTTPTTYEADNYCFRFRVLGDPYAVDTGSVIDGTFRMHPMMLQGVPSFKVEWTDGTPDLNGVLNWYGMGNPKNAGSTTEPSSSPYTAIFSTHNKTTWPKAVKITFRAVDQRDMLRGGRQFVQIIKIPD